MNLINKQKTWLVGDLHIGHERIINYCNRPFSNKEEMEEYYIETFNSQCKAGDRIYNLGDMAWSTYPWERFISRINTKEWHHIWGNHDLPRKEREKTPGVRSFADIRKLKMYGQSAILCHYAMRSWLGKREGVFMLFGHSHGCLPNYGKSMDVGVDAVGHKMIEWDEIVAIMADKEQDQEW